MSAEVKRESGEDFPMIHYGQERAYRCQSRTSLEVVQVHMIYRVCVVLWTVQFQPASACAIQSYPRGASQNCSQDHKHKHEQLAQSLQACQQSKLILNVSDMRVVRNPPSRSVRQGGGE